MAARFVPNLLAIDELLRGPTGPVYRHLNSFGRQVEAQAKRTSPVWDGTLRASTLATPINVGPAGLSLRVGSGLYYAIIVHQGHKAFGPRTAPYLKFVWKQRGGIYVTTKHVRKVAGRPYIWDALVFVNEAQPPGRQFKLEPNNPSPLIT